MILALSLLLLQNDKAQANARDDAWEPGPTGWVAHCKSLYTSTGKTAGMVLHVGDSITHANQYGQWPRFGAGKTGEDVTLLTWCMATTGSTSGTPATDTNGFNLCGTDVANRSMTAAGGVSTAEYLSGSGNGGVAMPSTTNTATAQGYVANATYDGDLHIDTVAAAFTAAQFAVVMLGTNDVRGGRAASATVADLTAIVDVLEGRNIVVILSTLPPMISFDVLPTNIAIRTFASTRKLPLIDFYEEILARQPGTAWQGTLIQALPDGVHPTFGNSAGDPYASGGNPATHQTGSNAANDGYLLRSWLTIQKLKEVKSLVVDAPAVPPVVVPPVVVPPAAVAGSSSRDNENGCSCGTATPSGVPWSVLALLSLAWAGRRR